MGRDRDRAAPDSGCEFGTLRRDAAVHAGPGAPVEDSPTLARMRELIALEAAARKTERRRLEAEINALSAEVAALRARPRVDLLAAALGLPVQKWRAELRLWREIREVRRSGLFDAAWYEARYGDVARSGMDPLLHYMRHGAREGRNPNPDFDSGWYVRTYGAPAGVNPLLDYIRNGATRDPGPFFSTSWYASEYPDVAKSGLHPLVHFQRHGRAEGRRPVPVGR